jgi:hypothetical protein
MERSAGYGKPYVSEYFRDPFLWDAYWGLSNSIDNIKKQGGKLDKDMSEKLCLDSRYLLAFAAPAAIQGGVSIEGYSIILSQLIQAEALVSGEEWPDGFRASIGNCINEFMDPKDISEIYGVSGEILFERYSLRKKMKKGLVKKVLGKVGKAVFGERIEELRRVPC